MEDTITYEDHRYGVDVGLNDLQVDLAVQRATVPARLRKIAEHFDMILVGELLVSQRADGGLYVLDGHHRLSAAKRQNGSAPATLKAEIFTGLSRADEARLFLGRNDRANVRSHDRFRNLATLGDQETLGVQMAAQAAGFVFISDDVDDATFRDRAAGVAIVREADKRKGDVTGVDHLRRVLTFYARAYGNQDRVESMLLKATSKIFLKFENVDEDRLYERLRGLPPQEIIRQAIQHYATESAVRSLSKVTAAIEVIAEQYNRGLPPDSVKRIRL